VQYFFWQLLSPPPYAFGHAVGKVRAAAVIDSDSNFKPVDMGAVRDICTLVSEIPALLFPTAPLEIHGAGPKSSYQDII
jgi:hypothetical protein